MMRIRWTTSAFDELVGIVQYIRKENPPAAGKIAEAILGDIERLEKFPYLGRQERYTERANWFPPLTSSCTALRTKSSKSCTSGMARRTGGDSLQQHDSNAPVSPSPVSVLLELGYEFLHVPRDFI